MTGNLIDEPKLMAMLLNEFFSSVFTTEDQTNIQSLEETTRPENRQGREIYVMQRVVVRGDTSVGRQCRVGFHRDQS